MPIIDAAIIADCRAQIDTQFGPINPDLLPAEISKVDGYRQKLAICIAESGIFVRDNALVTVTGVQPGSGTAPGTLT